MATKERKNQKFGRHRASDRRCNPSVKRYHFAERWKGNKLRKLRRHVADHPEDKRAASALLLLSRGDSGPAGTYPKPPYPTVVRVVMEDLQLEYREHHRKDGKVVLHEGSSSKPLFCVESTSNVTQERTLSYADALKFYEKSHGACSLVQRTKDEVIVLKNKGAMPPKGFENQLRNAYGNLRSTHG